MSFRWLNTLDGGGDTIPADQEPTPVAAASNAGKKSANSFTLQKSGLNVVANAIYQFSFAYLYQDPENASELLIGPRSPNFSFTLEAPDYTKPVTNLVVTPGLLLYGVKWDPIDKSLPANKWFIDAQIYESLTGAFAGEEYLVWNGTGNSATILVSNTNNRWIRVDTRDQDYHKKSVTYGPFKASDPIVVDTTGPANVTSVDTSVSGIDTSGYLGFNAFVNISWPAVTGGGIRGYRIRFSNDNGATYSYVDSPGTGTTYKLAGLAIGSTYQVAVATYDEYNNTSSAYIAGPNVTVAGTPSVSNFITGGPFQFGVGVGGVNTNKGLYFDSSNYWYVNATNSARLKVGGATSNYLLWDGSTFAIDGNITARGGTFSGNIFMSTTGASIYSGTIDSATGNLTGNGFALNSTGLKVANGTNSVTLSAANGTITANAGSIAGWNLSGTTLSKNNVILDSAGQIQLGSTAATAFYLNTGLVNGGFTWLAWAGNNVPDANAKFRVRSDGTLFVNGAVFGTGTTIAGYATSDQLATTNTNLATTNTNLATTNTNLATTNTNLGTTNTAVATKLTKSAATITDSANNITAINSAGITVFSTGSASATGPGTGARVVMNSSGIAAYNSLNVPTFSIDASTGSAIFKGDLTGASGTFSGPLSATSGSIAGWTIGTSSISSGGTSINSNGTISVGVTGDSALYMKAGSDIRLDAAVGASSYIKFYTAGATGWTTAISQLQGGDFRMYSNYLGQFTMLSVSTTIADYVAVASLNNATTNEVLKVSRNFSTNALLNSDIATSTQMIQFYKRRNDGSNTIGVGRINATNSTTTPVFAAGSDERLKKNIEIFNDTSFIDDIKNINVYKFHDNLAEDTDEKAIGFLAKEFYPKYMDIVDGVPGAVDEDGDPEYMSIFRENLIPHLFNAVKYLSAKIEEIEGRLENV
jgi:hypothetical protein